MKDLIVFPQTAEIPPNGEIPKDGIFAIIDKDEKEKETKTLDV